MLAFFKLQEWWIKLHGEDAEILGQDYKLEFNSDHDQTPILYCMNSEQSFRPVINTDVHYFY